MVMRLHARPLSGGEPCEPCLYVMQERPELLVVSLFDGYAGDSYMQDSLSDMPTEVCTEEGFQRVVAFQATRMMAAIDAHERGASHQRIDSGDPAHCPETEQACLKEPGIWAISRFPRHRRQRKRMIALTSLAPTRLSCASCGCGVAIAKWLTQHFYDWHRAPADVVERMSQAWLAACPRQPECPLRGFLRSWQQYARREILFEEFLDNCDGSHEYCTWADAMDLGPERYRKTRLEKHQVITAILRDIVGNPFRPARLNSDILQWRDGTVAKIAGMIEASGRFDLMHVLADALEDAGCTDEFLLAHCRAAPDPHVRGCWALDAILRGRQEGDAPSSARPGFC